jgi:hypothetical protein
MAKSLKLQVFQGTDRNTVMHMFEIPLTHFVSTVECGISALAEGLQQCENAGQNATSFYN